MNKRGLLAAGLAVLLVAVDPAPAGVTVTLVTAGGSDNSVTVAPGGTFSVDIRYDISGTHILATQVQLMAGAPNVLDVLDGTYNTLDWNDDVVASAYPITPEGLDPLETHPVGTFPLRGQIGPGTTVLATLRLAVDPSATAGTYTLNVTGIVSPDQTYTDLGGTAGPDFTVIVSTGGTPPAGGGGTTPPDNGGGGTTPPDNGGGGTVPPDNGGGGTTPPDGGSGTTPPDNGGGGTTPPDGGGGTTPPNNGTTPPTFFPRGCGAGVVESVALSVTVLFLTRRRAHR